MPVEEVDFSPLKQGDAQFVGPRGPQRVFLIPFPSRSTTKISTNANLLENHYRTTADHPDHPKHPDQPGHPDHSDQLGHLYQENFNLADLILELEFLPKAQYVASKSNTYTNEKKDTISVFKEATFDNKRQEGAIQRAAKYNYISFKCASGCAQHSPVRVYQNTQKYFK